ncbi:tRNA epoxyqueuosine(34) reductase QueG [bacterium]|nr:tRNA epoxyqueuosine(34) reductase QueG [bacterium]
MDWQTLVTHAHSLGFSAVGVSPAEPYRGAEAYRRWIEAGHHAEMAWMSRNMERRSDPREVVPTAASVLSLWMAYDPGPLGPMPQDVPRGRVARYALGLDYHDLIPERLRALSRLLDDPVARAYVDTGPVLERSAAERAGLGWIGKNGCVISPKRGSYGFLAEIITAVPLPVAEAPHPVRCGTCTRCIPACPTGAIVSPGVIDSRRCISYLTIEHRGPIPRELRPLMGEWVFGCDICQEVCPWNRHSVQATEPAYSPKAGRAYPDLVELLLQTQEEFSARFKGSPIKRTKRHGMARNAAIALGNLGLSSTVPALAQALREDPDATVRGSSAWALGRIGGDSAREALEAALETETDPSVIEEVRWALETIG